jgi:hypothetical protein
MDRQTALLLALGTLVAASLAVGVGGWILLVRDRRLGKMNATASAAASGDIAAEAPTEATEPHPEVNDKLEVDQTNGSVEPGPVA